MIDIASWHGVKRWGMARMKRRKGREEHKGSVKYFDGCTVGRGGSGTGSARIAHFDTSGECRIRYRKSWYYAKLEGRVLRLLSGVVWVLSYLPFFFLLGRECDRQGVLGTALLPDCTV